MQEVLVVRPEIAVNDFLPIFISSTLVLVFGLLYVAIYTLVKLGKLKAYLMPSAYLFWVLQVYCLYFFANMIQSEPFTIKVLMVTMVAYLFVPHLYYRLIMATEE